MNRERIAWLLSFLLLAICALRSPSAAQRDSDYLFVRTLVDIQRQVATNYVEPVDENKLEQAAIDGMLNQLDPFTNYVPPARSEDFDRMLEGTFKGNLVASSRIELASTAHVMGDVRSTKLVIAEGATFVGNCHVSPDALKDVKPSEFVVPVAATPI